MGQKMINFDSLRMLGYELFGPSVGIFITKLSENIANRGKKVLLFHREGYYFLQLMENYFKRISKSDSSALLHEIMISRAFLAKLSTLDCNFLSIALMHPYKGTLYSLLKDRFAFSNQDCSLMNHKILDMSVNTEYNRDTIVDLVNNITKPLHASISQKKDIFGEYVNKILTGEKSFTCVDIGFSATTQRLLSALYGYNSHGYYMYLHSSFNQWHSEQCSAEGLVLENTRHGEGNALVDYSLVLESIFTSENGQLCDIYYDNGIQFIFGHKGSVQSYFYFTQPIIQGIDQFIKAMHASEIKGDEVDNILDVEKTYEIYLKHVNTSSMQFLRSFIEIDDHFSGNAMIKPFKFLQGIGE